MHISISQFNIMQISKIKLCLKKIEKVDLITVIIKMPLKGIPKILTPDILHALSSMGHGDEIVLGRLKSH